MSDLQGSGIDRENLYNIQIISDALVAKFGDGAIDVAARQALIVTDAGRQTWLAIIAKIERQDLPG